MTTPTCLYPHCDREPRGRLDWCTTHRQQYQRQGRMWPIAKPGGQPKHRQCDQPDCGRPHEGHGLCIGHLQQQRKGKPLTPILVPKRERQTPAEKGCQHPGCPNAHKALGWCRTHWGRHRRGVPLDGTPAPTTARPTRLCEQDACEQKYYAKGLCTAHYKAARRTPPTPSPAPAPKPVKAARTPPTAREPRPVSNLPTGWHKPATPPKKAPIRPDERSTDAILWEQMHPEAWEHAAAIVRHKLERWGDGDLADMLLGEEAA